MIWGLDWTIVWEFQLVYPRWNERIKASATLSGSYWFVHITDSFLPCTTCCSELLSNSTAGKWIASAARSIGATTISPTAVNGSSSHLCTEIDVRTKTLGNNCWIGKLMYWFILWVSVFGAEFGSCCLPLRLTQIEWMYAWNSTCSSFLEKTLKGSQRWCSRI